LWDRHWRYCLALFDELEQHAFAELPQTYALLVADLPKFRVQLIRYVYYFTHGWSP
jgi:hypothetical protein